MSVGRLVRWWGGAVKRDCFSAKMDLAGDGDAAGIAS